jgi:hypothetical protein
VKPQAKRKIKERMPNDCASKVSKIELLTAVRLPADLGQLTPRYTFPKPAFLPELCEIGRETQ